MHKIIIDVREPGEYAAGHVAGAINLPVGGLAGDLPGLDGVPKDAQIILYCRSGSRSGVAINILQAKGYTNLTNGVNQKQVTAKHQQSAPNKTNLPPVEDGQLSGIFFL